MLSEDGGAEAPRWHVRLIPTSCRAADDDRAHTRRRPPHVTREFGLLYTDAEHFARALGHLLRMRGSCVFVKVHAAGVSPLPPGRLRAGHTGLAKNTLLDRFRDDDNSAWWRCFTLRPVAPASTGCCSSAPTMRSLSRCPRPICVCAPGRGSRTKERTERPQPVFAQCERNPLCSRGFKHQGHTGTCPSAKTKPRRSSAGAGSGTRPSAKVLRSCGVVGLGPEAQAARAARLQHGRDHRQR